MPEEVVELLKSIDQKLNEIVKDNDLPQIIRPPQIAEEYGCNRNVATELCKKYGTKIGGYGIERQRLKELLQNGGTEILERKWVKWAKEKSNFTVK